MKHYVSSFIGIVCVLCLCGAVGAAIPPAFQYSGVLSNAQGEPLNGKWYVRFSLYDDATAGTRVWSKKQLVSITDGQFATELSPKIDFDKEYWLGLTVSNDAEMTPRQKLGSVPYAEAAKSLEADTLSLASEANNAVLRIERISADANETIPATEIINSGTGYGLAIENTQEDARAALKIQSEAETYRPLVEIDNDPVGSTNGAGSSLKMTGKTSSPMAVLIQDGTGSGMTIQKYGDSSSAVMSVSNNIRGNALSVSQYGSTGYGVNVYQRSDWYPALRIWTGTRKANEGIIDVNSIFKVAQNEALSSRGVIQLGKWYLWVDASGDLRIKKYAPYSDFDGELVGQQ